MCLISQYYVYKASRSCILCFLCHPLFHKKNFLFTCFLMYGYKVMLTQHVQCEIFIRCNNKKDILVMFSVSVPSGEPSPPPPICPSPPSSSSPSPPSPPHPILDVFLEFFIIGKCVCVCVCVSFLINMHV